MISERSIGEWADMGNGIRKSHGRKLQAELGRLATRAKISERSFC